MHYRSSSARTALSSALSRLFLALSLTFGSGAAHAIEIAISIDTNGLTAPVVLEFLLEDGGPAANSAAIRGFTGALVDPAQLFREGAASGTLPGEVTLLDTGSIFGGFAGGARYDQAIEAGGIFSFIVDFSADFSNPGSGTDVLSIFLLDALDTGFPLYATDDLLDAVLVADANGIVAPGPTDRNQAFAVVTFATRAPPTTAPAPATVGLIGLALLPLLLGARRR